MQEFIKNIKLKILLIFILPTIGVIFFSSYYTIQKLDEYQDIKYLSNTIKFAHITTAFVKNLQKERGLSISLINKKSKFFLEKLNEQRIKSDKIFDKFKDFLFVHQKISNVLMIKTIIEQYGDIEDFRKRIDSNKVSLFEVLDFYSRIIDSLIISTGSLDIRSINKRFFVKIKGYTKLMSIGEINGKERALISYVLQEKKMDKNIRSELQKFESKSIYLKKIFLKEADVDTLLIFRKYIPKSFSKEFESIKQNIIYKNNFSSIAPSSWWKISTKYIDAIYNVNFDILKNLLQLKESLKKEAHISLILSIVFFIILLISGYFLEITISKMLDMATKLMDTSNREKRIYQVLAQFSEIALYDKDKRSILNSLNTLMFQSEEFLSNWISKVKNESIQPIVTENIAISLIRQSIDDSNINNIKLFRDIKKAIQEKHYILSLNKSSSCKICENTEMFGIFPIVIFDKVEYILVLAIKNSETFNIKIVDMVVKCIDILSFAFEKIDIQNKEIKLQKELKITSKAFDTHEAITIANAQGNIIKVNKAFSKITGYSPEEVIGKNPNVLKSGKHDKEFYETMWKKLKDTGYWQGEIYNKRKNGDIYPELLSISAVRDDKGIINNFIAHFLDISDIKKAQKSLEYKAKYDQLTQLLNRQSMFEKLEEVYHQNKKIKKYSGFLFIDVDNFKHINDYYGHNIGDKVLTVIADRLKNIAKDSDIVARIGGDEFAFIANYLSKDKDIAMQNISILAEKILDLFAQPLNIGKDYSIGISMSIGVKIFPDEEKDYEQVVVDADVAMYYAKKEGKNQFSFFNNRLDMESREFLILKKEFEEGLNNKELVLYYQPKISINDNSIAGFEALLRWNHPAKGLIYPDSFLYVTYNNKLSTILHKYVLEEVCKQIKIWINRYKDFDMKISVNISGEQFYNKYFVEDTLHIIDKIGIDPKYLDFEILEDVFLKDKQRVVSIIQKLQSKGISFSLDDFGTGYSSISLLHSLPIDNLKIDKTFVLNIFEDGNKELIKLSIDIANIFGINIVAEGVENKKTLDYLKSKGCKYYQGFYFSKAVPPNVVDEIIKNL